MQMNTMTLQKQTSLFTEESATSSQEGSRASPSPLPGSNLAQQMTDTSGLKCLEQYEKLNHAGLLAKMFPALLVGQMGWYSSRCYLTWNLKATKSGRVYFRLQASTPRTSEIGFGLLPTIKTSDSDGNNRKLTDWKNIAGNGKQYGISLPQLAANGLLPTPRTSDFQAPGEHGSGGKDLRTTILLPTPQASDNPAKDTGKRNQDGLQKRAFQTTGKTSQLNPRFVLEMMGFAPSHCDSAFEKMVWERYLKKKSTKSFQKRLRSGLKKPSKPEVTP